MSYTLDLQEDSAGDLYLSFPAEMIEELGWEEGDILEWNLKGNGIQLYRLNDSGGYEMGEE